VLSVSGSAGRLGQDRRSGISVSVLLLSDEWNGAHPITGIDETSILFSDCKDEDAKMHQESGEHGRTVGQGQHTIEKCSSMVPKSCLMVDDTDTQWWQSAQDTAGDKRLIMLFWSTSDSASSTTQPTTQCEIVKHRLI
jgi:hypothetical protein